MPQSAAAATTMPTTAAAPFQVTERVRWEDVDLVGIMRYSAFTRMLDVAEQELWREAGMTVTQVIERFGVWLPRRHLAIDFLAPARFDELLELRAGVTAIGTSSVTLRVEAWSADGETHHATITVVMVSIDGQTMQKVGLPDGVRENAARYMARG